MTAVTGGWEAVAGVTGALERGRSRPGGRIYGTLRWAGAAAFAALLIGLVVTVAAQSSEAFSHFGLSSIWSGTWDPAADQFGTGVLIVGTVITTLAAMVIVVPVGLGFAIFLSEQAPGWVASPLSSAIDLLAAIPSIVVGLWGLLVLTPVFARQVEPFLRSIPGLGYLFHGQAYGPSVILAAVVLAVMSLPAIVTLSRTALTGVPVADREAAMALGATRWQVVRRAVIPAARPGIEAAVTLAVGRALGESIAVAMVIGNRPSIPHSLLAPGATLGSALVNQFAEASPGLGTSAVIALGAVLLVLTLLVNLAGQTILQKRAARGRAGPAPLPRGPAVSPLDPGREESRPGPGAGRHLTAAVRLRSGRSLPRRRLTGAVTEALCGLAVLVGVAPLAALIYYTVVRGIGIVSWTFLTHSPTPPGIPGGGIGPAITGSAKIVGLALAMAVPIGLLAALFIFEQRGRLATAIRFSAEVMTGVPSIIVGIFAYAVLVRPLHHFSDLAAGFAIAVLMIPIMIRANEEAIRTVPTDLWEAGVALGARRSRVARSVVLRSALPGLLSGNLLGVSRGVGETAPLLFTVAAPTVAMTLLIYNDGTQAFQQAQRTAWGAALVLLATVLVLSLATRVIAWAYTRQAR
ncbi:MAG TPA: phosphate ABC transporter permease subunit PstC [Acidimicrobiales bacterium]|nr:phosphate ABC transporter permease subunit PstC [Acidimicrobiales bacterium]